MFRIIGGIVVYGFALFGLATYLGRSAHSAREGRRSWGRGSI